MEINLEALLGTLAAYFAIMAVLAVGTEVVLDILKLKALKKPISPSQTLAELRQWVPETEWKNLSQRVMHMEQVIREVDASLAEARAGFAELRQQAEPILKAGERLAPEKLGAVMRKLEARYQAVADNRIAWIRFLSLVIGIGWAVILQINSLDLLGAVIPDSVADLLGGSGALWYGIAGLALSGLGAAAGSSFWHDQMARLRQAQQVVDTAEQLKAQAAAIVSGIAAGQARASE